MSLARWSILALAALTTVGCATGLGPLRLDSDDPAVRVPAIKASGDAKRQKDVPALVDYLGSEDPVVRMFAIDSLEKLTGVTLGYRYYEDDFERSQAIARWREYLDGGNRSRPTSAPTTTPAVSAAGEASAVRVTHDD